MASGSKAHQHRRFEAGNTETYHLQPPAHALPAPPRSVPMEQARALYATAPPAGLAWYFVLDGAPWTFTDILQKAAELLNNNKRPHTCACSSGLRCATAASVAMPSVSIGSAPPPPPPPDAAAAAGSPAGSATGLPNAPPVAAAPAPGSPAGPPPAPGWPAAAGAAAPCAPGAPTTRTAGAAGGCAGALASAAGALAPAAGAAASGAGGAACGSRGASCSRRLQTCVCQVHGNVLRA